MPSGSSEVGHNTKAEGLRNAVGAEMTADQLHSFLANLSPLQQQRLSAHVAAAQQQSSADGNEEKNSPGKNDSTNVNVERK